jgi:hypothetical protein
MGMGFWFGCFVAELFGRVVVDGLLFLEGTLHRR